MRHQYRRLLLAGSICVVTGCSSGELPTSLEREPGPPGPPQLIGGSDPCQAAYGSFVWQLCHSYRLYSPWWQPALGYDCGIQCTAVFPFSSTDPKWQLGVSLLQSSTYFSCRDAGTRLVDLMNQGLVTKWIPYDWEYGSGQTVWGMTINSQSSGTTYGMQFWNGAWNHSGYLFFQFLMAHEAYHSLFPWSDEASATAFGNMCMGTNYTV